MQRYALFLTLCKKNPPLFLNIYKKPTDYKNRPVEKGEKKQDAAERKRFPSYRFRASRRDETFCASVIKISFKLNLEAKSVVSQ